MRRRGCVPLALTLVAGVLVGLSSVATVAAPAAAEQPPGFTEQVVFSGLQHPTKLVFSPDGRIFVAEKSGEILVYDSLTDPTPDVFADLSTQVHDWGDHGLLGLALPPNFPTNPYVYVLYTADAPIGGTAPVYHDACPNNQCVVSGRLSRLQASGNHMAGSEQVLINGWCEVSETHSVGTVAFGPDGDLWVSGGDGASPAVTDWGQEYTPSNPCGDPPGNVAGAAMNPPNAEGGALRAQSSQRTDGPALLNGTVIRVDPSTGAGLPDNPYASSSDPNKRRIVAYGLRNPFRFTFRPGTNEIWAGDVGWNDWEEIDRDANPLAPAVTNFGWPCYEGNGHQPSYDQANLTQCENLYTAGTATAPYYTYNHAAHVVPGESCATGGSSPTGVAFYPSTGGNYPSTYRNSLFWADYSRNCIWAMLPGSNGVPDPANMVVFDGGAQSPVDLEIGPGGDLYYVDITGGTIRRIRYSSDNHPPVAAATATPQAGRPPLDVAFDAHTSSDPDPGDMLSYAWDFNNDGTVDATGVTADHVYTAQGTFTARLTVTDSSGDSDSTTLTISVDNDAPTPVIDSPTTSLHYNVGDTISFSGHASDAQDGTEPASRLHWQAILHHCYTPDSCHLHFIQSWDGVASGSFQAPDHEYPSYVELQLTATDAGGASAVTSLRLDPHTVPITVTSNPSGMLVQVGSSSGVTPFTTTMVVGATDSVSALSPQAVGGGTYTFGHWSDGGSQTHVITAPGTATTFNATYTPGGTLPDLTGTVNGNGSRPIAGATVTLNPDGRTTTTDAAGHFTITGVNAGTYTLTASLATPLCANPVSAPVTMSGPQNVTLTLSQHTDAAGNTCADTVNPAAYIPANTVTTLTGDDNLLQVSTPFPLRFYGGLTSTAWLDTNGSIAFTNPGQSGLTWNTPIGAPGSRVNSVFPFGADFFIDSSASVRTQTVGTSPNRQYVVEWRNATFYGDRNSRVTVEAIFTEGTGTITFVYKDVADTASDTGAAALTGIENADGTDGLQYSYHQTVLRSGLAVTFTPADTAPIQTGSVTGTVSRSADSTPVSGATVTLSPTGATTTTASDGSYHFTGVPYGGYTVTATLGAARCEGLTGSGAVTVAGAATRNIATTQRADSFGYTCASGPSAYVAATTPLGLSGDDTTVQVSTPFPVRLYGQSYSTAWVDTNGVISFVNPGGSAVKFGTHIPDAGSPNAAVFALFDDLLVDGQASTWTAVTGTAPNRKYVIEWRNARFYNDGGRFTAEVIFSEANGDITLAYNNLAAGSPRAAGSQAVVGIENANGTDGFEYSFQQADLSASTSVTFHPPNAPPVQTATVAGHVTAGGSAAGSIAVSMAPGGYSTTTAADGSYSFGNVPYGSYTVTAGGGSATCGGQSAAAGVDVAGDRTLNLALTNVVRHDTFGNTCTDGPATYVAATTGFGLTGDDAEKTLTLPFPVHLYGTSYTTAYVDTNGEVAFVNPGRSYIYSDPAIPSTAAPNAVIYAFWDDMMVDGQAQILTSTTGTAPNRKFVLEWRNVTFYNDRNSRATFEVVFTEGSGDISIIWGAESGGAASGGSAVCGIENADGTDAFQYSFRQPVLLSGRGVTFHPPS